MDCIFKIYLEEILQNILQEDIIRNKMDVLKSIKPRTFVQ